MDKKLLDYGEIYLITIGKKQYVGQCQMYIGNDHRKHGTMGRWKQHVRVAFSKDGKKHYVYFHSAIIKYGPENCKVDVLLQCKKEELDVWEIDMIKLFDTLSPNGFNLTTGGKTYKYSEDHINFLSDIKKGGKNPNYGKEMSQEQKNKISKTKLFVRKTNFDLPIYIYHYRNSNKEGYVIKNHPEIKYKSF